MRRFLPEAFQHRDFARLWVAMLSMGLASQMVAVAVGWQVYALHRSAFDLGLVGLAEFIPLPLLALPAGQLADRLPRRLVLAGSLLIDIGATVFLVVVTQRGVSALWPYLTLAALAGVSSSFGSPAARALVPMLIPRELLGPALALRSIGGQTAVVLGPALGGLVFVSSAEAVYVVAVGLLLVALIACLFLRYSDVAEAMSADETSRGVAGLLGGIRFLGRTRILLGAILLDLFAVLFGGAVALLPLFARSILHTGPIGLGVLRSAPAIGAIAGGLVITRWPIARRAGPTLLFVVAAFGASMIVFGLSRWLPVTLGALAVSGFVDMVSMNIRSTTAAFATPDALRGRVSAVENVFISASNELGAFESGAAAALLGAVPAVVIGGIATIAVALAWRPLFPQLARLDRMESLEPETGRLAPLAGDEPGAGLLPPRPMGAPDFESGSDAA